MAAETQTFIDFELRFKSGDIAPASFQKGKGEYGWLDDGRYVVKFENDYGTTTLEAQPDTLNSIQITERVEVVKRKHGATILELT